MIVCVFKKVSDNEILLVEQRAFLKERTKLILQEQFQDYYNQCLEYKIRTYVQDINGKIIFHYEPYSAFRRGLKVFCYSIYLIVLNVFLVLIMKLFSDWYFLV